MFKIFAIICALIFMSHASLAGTGYFSVIDDLPLMPGMVEKSADSVVFDTADGRIVETVAEIPVSSGAVKKFYSETLPSLGWQEDSKSDFVRENEVLKLSIEQKGRISHVRFNLSPKKE